MPHTALKSFLLAALAAGCMVLPAAGDNDAHLDMSVVQGGCATCHAGHGASRSPMLPEPQQQVCLSCHGSQGEVDRQVSRGVLAPGATPQLLSLTFALPYTHPLSAGAFSRREPGAVTCTSCHTPHRSSRAGTVESGRRPSPRDPTRFEFELCLSCHGSGGERQGLVDISRLTNPNNRSFHPITAPAEESSPSLRGDVHGIEINCTDCHGSSQGSGPRGPHGSSYPHILKQHYTLVDGRNESEDSYALCYGCHRRENVLAEDSPFPLHRLHVVDVMASCVTCHDAHGAVNNRALVHFGEETVRSGVSPSSSTGLLRFDSATEGSGSCYLTCHGVDHAPKSYGLMKDLAATFPDLFQPRQ